LVGAAEGARDGLEVGSGVVGAAVVEFEGDKLGCELEEILGPDDGLLLGFEESMLGFNDGSFDGLADK